MPVASCSSAWVISRAVGSSAGAGTACDGAWAGLARPVAHAEAHTTPNATIIPPQPIGLGTGPPPSLGMNSSRIIARCGGPCGLARVGVQDVGPRGQVARGGGDDRLRADPDPPAVADRPAD